MKPPGSPSTCPPTARPSSSSCSAIFTPSPSPAAKPRACPSATPPTPGAAGPTRYGAASSPDARFLYFAQKTTPGSVYNQMSFGWQIARRDMQSGEVDTLTQADGGAVRPLVSPDGRWLVYGTR